MTQSKSMKITTATIAAATTTPPPTPPTAAATSGEEKPVGWARYRRRCAQRDAIVTCCTTGWLELFMVNNNNCQPWLFGNRMQ